MIQRGLPTDFNGVEEFRLLGCRTIAGQGRRGEKARGQLPGVGGGAQVGTISALTLLFGIPGELAISAGIIVWLVTTMSVVPIGLLYAKIEGISIGQVARRSEDAEIALITSEL